MNQQEKDITIHMQLNNICNLVNGTWKHSTIVHSNGKQEENSSYLIPTLMLLGVIAATLSVIVAGYFHGNMHLITTLKNAANP